MEYLLRASKIIRITEVANSLLWTVYGVGEMSLYFVSCLAIGACM